MFGLKQKENIYAKASNYAADTPRVNIGVLKKPFYTPQKKTVSKFDRRSDTESRQSQRDAFSDVERPDTDKRYPAIIKIDDKSLGDKEYYRVEIQLWAEQKRGVGTPRNCLDSIDIYPGVHLLKSAEDRSSKQVFCGSVESDPLLEGVPGVNEGNAGWDKSEVEVASEPSASALYHLDITPTHHGKDIRCERKLTSSDSYKNGGARTVAFTVPTQKREVSGETTGPSTKLLK